MLNPANPHLPERRHPRPQPDHSQQRRQTSTPDPVVSHQVTAPALSADLWEIPVGQSVNLDGRTFVWNGSLFRNDHLDAVARAEHAQRVKRLLVAGVLLVLMALAVVYGLDWETMTGDERAPYTWAGRIAAFVLIARAWRVHENSPDQQAKEVDRVIRRQLGINHG